MWLINRILVFLLIISFAKVTNAETLVGEIPSSFDVEQGVANFSIPIQVPKGRGGVQPQLSLDYSSAGDNSIMGIGWTIGGVGAITRCGKTIAQDGEFLGIKFDSNTRFCMNGQRLIAISGEYGGVNTVYKTEVDDYSIITSVGGVKNNPKHFIVETKSGLTIQYGGADSSLQYKQGVLLWSIKTINDTTNNNPITFQYISKNNTLYISEVLYNFAKVKFIYQENRVDVVNHYIQGNKTSLDKKLVRAEVYYNDSFLHQYKISYEEMPSIELVSEISLCTKLDCLKPIKFGWQDKDLTLKISNKTYKSNISSVKALPNKWVDFNGDGYIDLCGFNQQSIVTCLTAQKVSDLKFYSKNKLLPLSKDSVNKWVDINGDGLQDICEMFRDEGRIKCLLKRKTGQSKNRLIYDDGISLSGINIKSAKHEAWIDYNNDQRIDYCRVYSSSIHCAISTGSGFSDKVIANFINEKLDFIEGSEQWVDVNADSKLDFCGISKISPSENHKKLFVPKCWLSGVDEIKIYSPKK